MKYQGIASDLDGTLLVGETLPDENLAALKAAHGSGIPIIIATARWVEMALRISSAVGMNHPVIACSGAQVYDPVTKTDLFDERLPEDFVRDLYALCDANRCIATVTVGDEVLLKLDGEPDAGVMEPEMRWVTKLEGAADTLPRIGAIQGSKVNAMIKNELWPNYRDRVNIFDSIGPAGKIIITITSRKADKGAALKCACVHMGIAPERVIAFGDAENDLSMFDVAGFSVAMGQAEQSIKDAADAVAARHDEAGVAQYLRTHLLA